MPRARSTPSIDTSGLLTLGAPAEPIAVGSSAWFAWLATATSFAFHGAGGSFTAHKERRGAQQAYWKAYRKRGGRLERAYLGRSEELTLERLAAVAATLADATRAPAPPRPTPSARAKVAVPAPEGWGPPLPQAADARPQEDGDNPARQVLGTKLRAPLARATLVERPQLVARLNAAAQAHQRLILVSAPAGSGKTTAIALWLRQLARTDVAWLSLDAGDNDLSLFLASLIAAIEQARPGAGVGALALLRVHPAQPPARLILAALVNALAGAGGRLLLVLDDYHVITSQPIHSLVAALLDNMPPTLQAVLVSRADPPLPLARLRARGQLAELRAADLRFSLAEASALLESTYQLGLPPATVAALTARTEGWVTGLQLAGLTLARQDAAEASQLLASFTGSHRYIFSYLAEEVFALQTPAVQAFLVQTGLLGRMCAPLCAAVTGRADAQALLEELEAHNLFVVQLDEQRRWYRYHQLFRDFLGEHLARTAGAAERAALHRRASAWFAEQGLVGEAVEHLLAAEDWPGVLELLAPLTSRDAIYNHVLDWPHWLAALPDAALQAQPEVALRFATTLINTGHAAAALRPLALLETAMRSSGHAEGLGRVRLTQAAAHMYLGEPWACISRGWEALRLLPPEAREQRASTTFFLGYAELMLGHVGAAFPLLVAAQAELQSSSDQPLALGSLYGLAQAHHALGHLHNAALLYGEVIRCAATAPYQQVPVAYRDYGALLYEWDDLAAAERALREGIQAGERTGRGRYFPEVYCILGQVLRARGDQDGAERAILAALDVAQLTAQPRCLTRAAALGAQLRLARGDLQGALAWLAEQQSPEAGSVHEDLQLVLTAARIRIAQEHEQAGAGDLQTTLRELEALRGQAEVDRRAADHIAILVQEALAWDALSQRGRAFDALGRALRLGEPEGYVRTFLDEGERLQGLLAAYREQAAPLEERLSAYLGRLAPGRASRRAGAAPTQAQPRLTPREQVMLRLLSEGATAQRAAEQLVISVHTARTHLKHIYAKLGASNRIEALERARSLGLLGPREGAPTARR